MKKEHLFIIVAIFFWGCKEDQPTARQVIEKYQQTIANSTSIDYTVDYRMKYFDYNDTLQYTTNCTLLKVVEDTVFGGEIWIENDSIDVYYDLEHLYVINHKQDTIKRYFPHQGQTFPLTGNTLGGVVRIFYLKDEDKLVSYMNDTTASVHVLATLLEGKQQTLVKYEFADDLPFEQAKRTIAFDKQTNLMTETSFSIKYEDEYQYNEWIIREPKLNQVSSEDLQRKFLALKTKYEVVDYVAPGAEDLAGLEVGIEAPSFSGQRFSDRKTVSLRDYKGKSVVLLDFWYRSCFACIEAKKYINEIHEKYADQGLVVLGVNPFDDREKDKDKIAKFIENNEVNYSSVFVEASVAKDYKVRAYPSFYIINKAGNIEHFILGSGDDIVQEIDSVMTKLQL